MWISKIELTYFKSYQRQVFQFPEPADGRNIVLIGGMNGYGKTSILESIYLCLYGKDAVIHLARAGLKTDDKKGYPTFLERAFNKEAKRDKRDTMSVRVTIHRTKTIAVDIQRNWYFRGNGVWHEEEVIVRDLKRDIPEAPKRDGQQNFHLSDYLEEFFVPAHIAPFFFFDGEEVKKLADQSRIEQVKQGLEGLLGVVILRNLADRLRQYENNRRSGVANVDEEKLNQLLTMLTKNESDYSSERARSEEMSSQVVLLKAERQSLIEIITASGGGGGDIATVKDLVEEREQIRTKQKDGHRRLELILRDRLPFHLIPRELLEAFRTQVLAEIKFFDWDSEKRSLEPKRGMFEAKFFSDSAEPIQPSLTDAQVAAIKRRLEDAWASLFFPPPSDCAKEVMHSYLHEPLRQNVLEFLGGLGLGQQEINDLLSEQKQLQQRIDELGKKINRVEGIDRDGTLANRKHQLKEVQDKLDQIAEEERSIDRRLHSLEAQVSSQRAEYEREKRKLDESSPVRQEIEKSERVRSVIDELIPSLFPLKVRKLAKEMTVVYKQLAHKNQVARIDIENDGASRILSATGREIISDRSAGENQIFATALIAGLARVSGVKAPMVVDTPLGRLDSEHRKNILNFWTSDKTRQVIFLSQDEEIDYHFFTSIKESVSKTYLLEHQDVGDGIGRTSAVEGQYFSRGRR